MIPGQHIVMVAGSPAVTLWGRSRGFEHRDTIQILMPGPNVFFAFLFRVPLAESTVAAQVLANGQGGLWIDGSRVSHRSEADRAAATPQGIATGKSGALAGKTQHDGGRTEFDRPDTTKGRWPSNLLLVHHPECRELGVKRVKGLGIGSAKNSSAKEHDGNRGPAFGGESRQAGTPMVCYADPDGLETVQSWDCHPTCPVGLLDRQSGVLKSGDPSNSVRNEGGNMLLGKGKGVPLSGFGDTGGASRFYPQFRNLQECLNWVNRLINGPCGSWVSGDP